MWLLCDIFSTWKQCMNSMINSFLGHPTKSVIFKKWGQCLPMLNDYNRLGQLILYNPSSDIINFEVLLFNKNTLSVGWRNICNRCIYDITFVNCFQPRCSTTKIISSITSLIQVCDWTIKETYKKPKFLQFGFYTCMINSSAIQFIIIEQISKERLPMLEVING